MSRKGSRGNIHEKIVAALGRLSHSKQRERSTQEVTRYHMEIGRFGLASAGKLWTRVELIETWSCLV